MHRLSLTSPILSTHNFETPVARMSVPPLLGFLLKEKLLKALLPICEQLFWPLPNYWMIWCLITGPIQRHIPCHITLLKSWTLFPKHKILQILDQNWNLKCLLTSKLVIWRVWKDSEVKMKWCYFIQWGNNFWTCENTHVPRKKTC